MNIYTVSIIVISIHVNLFHMLILKNKSDFTKRIAIVSKIFNNAFGIIDICKCIMIIIITKCD
ncbi:hypothetical protein [Clostridium saccharobutylicum]|nr:hypothetical protein [Clostridium saccharobutylicum]MBA9011608.1 hypothetical protein [Clostridium saccharobutylicum]NOW66468.1 hypothetical protein [Clostridium saccharobutylicum]